MVWKAKIINHRNEVRIAVEFEKEKELIRQIKLFKNAMWSQQKKLWHLPDTFENRVFFKLKQIEETLPSIEGQEHLQKFIRWLSAKRYSANTIKTYSEALKLFLVYFRQKSVSEINNNDVLDFNNDYILKKICLHPTKIK